MVSGEERGETKHGRPQSKREEARIAVMRRIYEICTHETELAPVEARSNNWLIEH